MTPLDLVSNVGITTYGFDKACIAAIQVLRKTESEALHLQILGRGLRLYPGRNGERPYQTKLLADILADPRSVVAVAPTGSGKSYLVADIIHAMLTIGRRVTYLVDRRVLVHDIIDRLTARGIRHGVQMPPFRKDPDALVQVASLSTVRRRGHHTGGDVLILDECHMAVSDSVQDILDAHGDAWRIGLTATPIRLDGKGLGRMFGRMVMGPTTAWMIENGWLCPFRAVGPPGPDLSSAKVSGGDYNQTVAGGILSTRGIVGDVVSMWLKHAQGRRTLLFAPTVEASIKYVEAFTAAGVAAAHVDAGTPDADRKVIWDRIELDAPPKADCLFIDHVSNIRELGFPDDIIGWTLDDSGEVRRASDDDPSLSVRCCPKCLLHFRSVFNTCPECGEPHVKSVREIKIRQGELEEIRKASIAKAVSRMDSAKKWESLKAEAKAKNYKIGWAIARYKFMFGRSPF